LIGFFRGGFFTALIASLKAQRLASTPLPDDRIDSSKAS